MTTELERRLRRDLGRLDEIELPPFEPTTPRAGVATTPLAGRPHRVVLLAAAIAVVVIAAASIGLVLTDRQQPSVSTSARSISIAPETTSPTTQPAPGPMSGDRAEAATFGDGLALIFDIEPIPNSPLRHRSDATTVWTGEMTVTLGGRSDIDTTPESVPPEPLPVVTFDPATGAFDMRGTTPKGMPAFRQIVAVTAGKIFALGGGNERTSSSTEANAGDRSQAAYRYDPTTDNWSEIAPVPQPVDNRDPWAVADDQIFMWPATGEPLVYDLAGDAWVQLPPPPSTIEAGGVSVWTGSKWVITGIRTDTNKPAGLIYTPATKSWRSTAPAPFSWRPANSIWNGSEMIIAAGGTAAKMVAYDPVTDAWRTLADRAQHPGFQGVAVDRYIVGVFKGTYVTLDPTNGDAGLWTNKPQSISEPAPYDDLVWTGRELLSVTSGIQAIMRPITQPPCTAEPLTNKRSNSQSWPDIVALTIGVYQRATPLDQPFEQIGPPIGRVCRRLQDSGVDPTTHEIQPGEAGELPVGTLIYLAPLEPPSKSVVAVLPDGTTVRYRPIDSN